MTPRITCLAIKYEDVDVEDISEFVLFGQDKMKYGFTSYINYLKTLTVL